MRTAPHLVPHPPPARVRVGRRPARRAGGRCRQARRLGVVVVAMTASGGALLVFGLLAAVGGLRRLVGVGRGGGKGGGRRPGGQVTAVAGTR